MRCFYCFAILITIAIGILMFFFPQIPEKGREDVFASENVILPQVPQGYSLEKPVVEAEIGLPLKKGKVSSYFGMRENPVTGEVKFHAGYDIAAKEGEEIYCVLDGKVKVSKFDKGYGNYVIIEHKNNTETLYAHMKEVNVKENEEIKKGDTVGSVGKTGTATGNHLHFELIINGVRFDPEWVLCGEYD